MCLYQFPSKRLWWSDNYLAPLLDSQMIVYHFTYYSIRIFFLSSLPIAAWLELNLINGTSENFTDVVFAWENLKSKRSYTRFRRANMCFMPTAYTTGFVQTLLVHSVAALSSPIPKQAIQCPLLDPSIPITRTPTSTDKMSLHSNKKKTLVLGWISLILPVDSRWYQQTDLLARV